MCSELAKVILNTSQTFRFVDEEEHPTADEWWHLEDNTELQDHVGSENADKELMQVLSPHMVNHRENSHYLQGNCS
jgi:hypothetical protein